MSTKSNLMGFYNPIPPFKKEYDSPVFCLIYTLGEPLPEGDIQVRPPPKELHIKYFTDRQEVKILVP
jgi:hypothetical protein